MHTLPANAEDVHYISEDKSKAVFFINHHIGEDQYPKSNLKIEQFKAHIQELKNDEYNVLPVPEIINKIKLGEYLPNHTVGITLDGAYRSTFKNAIPLLLKAKLPFTLFIAPERIDRNSDYYMNWNEIRKLAKNRLVSIGALPFSYSHIYSIPKEEQQQQWSRSLARFDEELTQKPLVFAWPYGEYTESMKDTMKQYHFIGGFAQHSGVAFHGSDIMAVPRFSMTEQYGNIDRFNLAAHSYPLPTTKTEPLEMLLSKDKTTISFSLSSELKEINRLSCFISDIGKVNLIRENETDITIKFDTPLSEKRIRMNCTLPVLSVNESKQSNKQYWRWYGRLFIKEDNDDKDVSYQNFSLLYYLE